MTSLIIFSLLVFLLGTIVFAKQFLKKFKHNKTISIAFFLSSLYFLLSFLAQLNGFVQCRNNLFIQNCAQIPLANDMPVIRVGFDLLSPVFLTAMKLTIIFAAIFWLLSLLKVKKPLGNY